MIYMDHGATTPVDDKVLEAMLPYFKENFGNPSSVYQLGAASKNAIEKARRQAAALIGAKTNEVFFTSGGTESDNWAIRGALWMKKEKGCHVITSKIEHHAVLHTLDRLQEEGLCEVTYVPVDHAGRINPEDVKKVIRKDTVLITVMLANNEVGTIEPIKEIAALAHENDIIMHTDAVQAVGHIPVNVTELGVDMLSASGHKLSGPKGVGFLYSRENLPLRSFLQGGPQEKNRRAGTENVPGIVGFGAACEFAADRMAEDIEKETGMRDHMIARLTSEIPGCTLSGDPTDRLPGNVHVCIPGILGEMMLIRLDMKGICASAGSACTSGSLEPSHVLAAMGKTAEESSGALRLTIGRENTMEEADTVCDEVAAAALAMGL